MKTARPLQSISLAGLLLGCGQGSGTLSADLPSLHDGDSAVAKGYVAVQSRECGRCHQSPDPRAGVLSGQETPVEATQSYGANLTPDPDTGMDAWDADSIATAVLHGIDERGARLCPPMPRFAEAGMGYDEAIAVALYLQSLTPVRRVVPVSTCRDRLPPNDAGP